MTHRLATALCFLFALALCGHARADAASEAQLQYELGTELYKQQRYAQAIEHFIASNRLVPNANVVLNIARTFEFLKRDVSAYNWYVTYLAFELTAEQRAAGNSALVALGKRVSVVDLAANPSGAEIFIDRVDLGSVGVAPRKVALEPGAREIIVQKSGFRETRHPVQAVKGMVVAAELTLARITGTLVVQSTPPGAQVTLEGEEHALGITPLRAELPVGKARIVLSLNGYGSQVRAVELADGQATPVTVELAPDASQLAVLSVKGNTPKASVLVNGKVAGTAPLTINTLPPGPSRIEIRADGLEPWSTAAILEAGAATRVEYELVDPDDRTWPGWSYLGYSLGATSLVVGGIVGVVAVSEKSAFEANPSRGSYDNVEQLNVTADVLMGTGIAILVGTVLWDILRAPDPHSSGRVTLDR